LLLFWSSKKVKENRLGPQGEIGWCRTPTKGEFRWMFCLCHPFGILGDCVHHDAGGGVGTSKTSIPEGNWLVAEHQPMVKVKGEFRWMFCLCHPYGVLQVLFHVFLLPYHPFGVLGDCAHSAGGGVSFGIANSEERFGWWRNTNQR
jgi:hypothetical protein